MCNKRIKLNLLMTWLVGVTICCVAPVVLAGPLDRGEMQPRNNPAASSMIRVPGVLGQSERYALEILQRAGLNVNTKYIQRSIEKYAGRSGRVVKQIPSAGGITMLGSSVTIMIYKVKDKQVDESGGGYDDAGNTGDDSNNAGGGYGGNAGGGYDDAGNTGDGTNNAGGGRYGNNTDGSYGKAGKGTGNSGGTYGDSGSDGYSGKGYGTDEAAPEDGTSGPDWGSPGSDFEGGNSAP